MAGKPIPSWTSDKSFAGLPTLETLHQQSGVKIARLRLLLRGVDRWKCKDNTVRYDPIAAAAALESWEDDSDEDTDDGSDGSASEPLPADPALASVALHQRATQLALGTLQRSLNAQNDVIRQMAEPLRMGMQLVKEAQDVLRARLSKYDRQWDRMVLLLEELQSTQAEREAARARNANRIAMQGKALEAAQRYLPDVLEKFSLTMEANYALEIARSVEPEHLEAFIDLGVLPPEKEPLARRLIEILKRHRKEPHGNTTQASSTAGSAPDTGGQATNAAASEMRDAANGAAQ